jgi:hypothetical protein
LENRELKLTRPPYGEVRETAMFYRIQTDHRRTALELSIDTIKDAAARDAEKIGASFSSGETSLMEAWVIESLAQGAYLREFHIWEKDTKEYFNRQYERQGGKPVNWRESPEAHTKKIEKQLAHFNAAVEKTVIDTLERVRRRTNEIKHDPGLLISHFVQWSDVDELLKVVWQFWDELDRQEEFSFPRGMHKRI